MAAQTSAVDQLLATKFFVPVASQPLVARTRLTALLNEGLHRRLTLVCAPAGFGKSTLLAEWVRSLPPPPDGPFVAWISLDEDDDDPSRFGDYFISALDKVSPGVGSQALEHLYTPEGPDSKAGMTVLINRLVDSGAEHLIVLDDYHFITDPSIHGGLAYLLDHLPPNVHTVISTRSEPPPSLPLARLRARGEIVEVRTDDLRCTLEEGIRFIRYTFGIDLPDDASREVIERTEGWLVGLQLLSLSLRGRSDPGKMLEELSGAHDYILDYLTEEVLRRQPKEVQTFLLQTSILDRLTASLCDAVMGYDLDSGQSDSQRSLQEQAVTRSRGSGEAHGESHSQSILRYLERSNLFLARLDPQRQWYRYHHLFTEALRYQLERRYDEQVPLLEGRPGKLAGNDVNGAPDGIPSVALLHKRASNWYRENGYDNEAVEHALLAGDWNLALNLIAVALAQNGVLPWHTSPAKPDQPTDMRVAFAQLGILPPRLPLLLRWFGRFPAEVLRVRPAVCLIYALILIADRQGQQAMPWLDAAETVLSDEQEWKEPSPETAQKTRAREGERKIMLAWIAILRAFNAATVEEDGERAQALCDEAMSYLTPGDHLELSLIGYTRFPAYLSLGNAVEAARFALQSSEQNKQIGVTFQQITSLACLGAILQMEGKLREAEATFQQAMTLGGSENRPAFATSGIPYVYRADLLREWNRLDEALDVLRKGMELAGEAWFPPLQLDAAYDVLARLRLSRGEPDDAWSALEGSNLTPEVIPQEGVVQAVMAAHPAGIKETTEDTTRVPMRYLHPWCADAERVRVWLARGETDRAARWVEQLVKRREADLIARGRPYPAQYRRDCEDIARARVALALSRPGEALEILEPVAVSALEGGRVSQMIEIKLLQAIAFSLGGQNHKGDGANEGRALATLAEAVQLGEGESFIRSFVDEGPRVAALLSRLRTRERNPQTPALTALSAQTIAYIDRLMAAFESTGQATLASKRTPIVVQPRGQGAGGSGTYGEVLPEPLSDRELEVLHLLARGASNAQIAEQLVLAPNTVKRHVSNIFEKLGASNRTQAVAQARSFGLLDA